MKTLGNKLYIYRFAIAMLVLSILIGVSGISVTSAILSDSFEKTPAGQQMLGINVEIVSNTLALALFGFAFVQERERERKRKEEAASEHQKEIDAVTQRRLGRIVNEIETLEETMRDLTEHGIHSLDRHIWERAAFDSAKNHLEEHANTMPGLYFALDKFYMAVDALREADWERAKHNRRRMTWLGRRLHSREATEHIVVKHIENFMVKLEAVRKVMADYGYTPQTIAAPAPVEAPAARRRITWSWR